MDAARGGTLDYSASRSGVAVDMRGDAAAGEPGELDRVLPGARGFVGGPGPDRVQAPDGGARLVGRAGDDHLIGGQAGDNDIAGGGGDDHLIGGAVRHNGISGGAGDDVILGGARYDRLEGEAGSDVVAGGGGDDELLSGSDAPARRADRDVLAGGDGDDYLLGGAGQDTLDGGAGSDDLIGMTGVDRLLARDGNADAVECAGTFDEVPVPGHDLAVLDPRDEQSGCGRVRRSGPPAAELLGVVDDRSDRDGAVLYAYVGCPAARARGCKATLQATAFRRRYPACAVRVPAGSRRRVRMAIRERPDELPARSYSVDVRLSSREPGGRIRRQRLTVDIERPRRLIAQPPPGGGTIAAPRTGCRTSPRS